MKSSSLSSKKIARCRSKSIDEPLGWSQPLLRRLTRSCLYPLRPLNGLLGLRRKGSPHSSYTARWRTLGDSISRAACTMLAYYRSLECSRSLALRLLVRARRALPRPATMVPLPGHRGGVLQVGHLSRCAASAGASNIKVGHATGGVASRRGVHVPGEERRAHGVVRGGRGARLGLHAYTFSRACHALPPHAPTRRHLTCLSALL